MAGQLLFSTVEQKARERGLTIERIRRTMDGVTYRYEIFQDGSTVAPAEDLTEAWQTIHYWQ